MTPLLSSTFAAFHPENDIAIKIITLFEMIPQLAGFSVAERSEAGEDGVPARLVIGDVTFWPPIGKEEQARAGRQIADVLSAFVQQRPEMLDMLSGRSFTRTLHEVPDSRNAPLRQRV
jgi:hypothetical protein